MAAWSSSPARSTSWRSAVRRVAELLVRLGSTASLPAQGEARRSRMADVPVLAIALEAGRVQLVLDRTYSEHLLGWIEATLADLA